MQDFSLVSLPRYTNLRPFRQNIQNAKVASRLFKASPDSATPQSWHHHHPPRLSMPCRLDSCDSYTDRGNTFEVLDWNLAEDSPEPKKHQLHWSRQLPLFAGEVNGEEGEGEGEEGEGKKKRRRSRMVNRFNSNPTENRWVLIYGFKDKTPEAAMDTRSTRMFSLFLFFCNSILLNESSPWEAETYEHSQSSTTS